MADWQFAGEALDQTEMQDANMVVREALYECRCSNPMAVLANVLLEMAIHYGVPKETVKAAIAEGYDWKLRNRPDAR